MKTVLVASLITIASSGAGSETVTGVAIAVTGAVMLAFGAETEDVTGTAEATGSSSPWKY